MISISGINLAKTCLKLVDDLTKQCNDGIGLDFDYMQALFSIIALLGLTY